MSTIRTKRLVLRAYQPQDREDYLDLVTDPEVMSHIEGGAIDRDTAGVWWHRLINGLFGKGIRWCARTVEDSRYAGHAMINYTRPGEACELGYILPRDEWGKGYATEIATALAEFSRDEMGLDKIYGTVDEDFAASINVLKKAGMEFFGYDHDENGRYLVYILKHRNDEK